VLVLGLDFETTGFDLINDRIIEVGAVLWDTDTSQVVHGYGEFIHHDGVTALTPEISKITGISSVEILRKFGVGEHVGLSKLCSYFERSEAKAIVAHNGNLFDKPMLARALERLRIGSSIISSQWIDTRTDLPFKDQPDSMKLKYMAADLGFLNPFPHRAQYDVLTMLKLLSNFNIDEVLELSKVPMITIYARVDYEDRQKAKDRKFSWEKIGDKVYPKKWVKLIRETSFEKEKNEAPFKISRLL